MNVYVWKDDTIRILPFKVTRKGAKLDGKPLSPENWESLRPKILPLYEEGLRFDLWNKGGFYEYLSIKLPVNDPNDLLDDDLERAFEQGIQNARELTKNRWESLIKAGVIFFCVLFGVGAFLLFTVMLNKGTADFGANFAGVIKSFNVSSVTGVLGG